MPDFTCVINAHNEGYIAKEALESVFRNKFEVEKLGLSVEILVVLDRGSVDTVNLIDSYGTLVKAHKVSFGDLGLARNYGISKSRGTFIALLDADDIWCDDWLLRTYNCIGALGAEELRIFHPEINLYFKSKDRPDGGQFKAVKQVGQDSLGIEFYELAHKNIWSSAVIAPREVFLSCPYVSVNESEGVGFEDWDFNLATIAKGYKHEVVPSTYHFVEEKDVSMRLEFAAKRLSPRYHDWWITTDLPGWN